MKLNVISKLAAALLFAGAVGAASASPVYVGSWHVGDGPQWGSTQVTYSGQQAAALLFGGNASDYVISTISTSIASINNMAWYDGWGAPFATLSQSFASSATYVPGAFSSYVLDHSCSNRYGNLTQSCAAGDTYVNYAFRVAAVNAVPEPATLGLVGLALAGVAATRRKPKVAAKAQA